jgi:formyl-CoA transferase
VNGTPQEAGNSHTSVLDGVTVLDLSIARAGPAAVRTLVEWGASAIRVEMPGDDGVVRDPMSSDYINLHANKRLMNLNLKTPEGHEILLRLLETSDILVENFRPPVKHKLGIGYEDLRVQFPRLIYGSISGYGQDGPSADKGAVDQIIQGLSGLMSVTGLPGGTPVRAGIAVADLAAGAILTNGLLLALLERERSGQGQWVQVSLLESMISFMDFQAVRWIADHEVSGPAGNHHPSMTPMGTFSTSDGYLNVAAPSDRLWERLCLALRAPDLGARPEYGTAALRHANGDALRDELERTLKTRTREEWMTAFDAVGVPCGPVNSVAEVFADPQVEHLAMTTEVQHPGRGLVPILRSPITMTRSRPVPKVTAPVGGQDTVRILAELGYTADEITTFRSREVI